MSWALAGAGAGLSALGGLVGGASANRQARKARDWYDMRTWQGRDRMGGLAYGSAFQDLLKAGDLSGQPGSESEMLAALERFNTATGGPVIQQFRDLVPLAQGRMGEMRSRMGDRTKRVMRGVGNAQRLALGAEDLATSTRSGRDAIIDRDFTRAGKEADQMLAAKLGAAGMGRSTAGLMARAGSSRRYAESAGDAKQRNAEGMLDRLLSARGQRIGLESEAARMEGGLLGEEINFDNMTLDRELALRQIAPNAMLGLQQSSVLNPWLEQNTSQYYPQTSGAGAALGSIGQFASGVGGMMIGQQQQRQQFDDLLNNPAFIQMLGGRR